jgi:riboflavin synthase
MFTGLIRDLGKIGSFESGQLLVHVAEDFLRDVRTGDSIAVNGVCLSVTSMEKERFTVFVSEETRRLTTTAMNPVGTLVNLEKPMQLGDRIHGHLVQGHVDGIGEVEDFHRQGQAWLLRVRFPVSLGKYIVHKGSIAVNGVSLTVAKKEKTWFEVAVIPETVERTVMKFFQKNDKVNLETDLVAKYVESLFPDHG